MKFLGSLLLGAGLVLALINFGVWEDEMIWSVLDTYWPALIIYFSLLGWVSDLQRRSWFGAFWNVVGMGIGTVLLLSNLGYLNVSWSGLLIPGALIVFGILLLFGKSGGGKPRTQIRYVDPVPAPPHAADAFSMPSPDAVPLDDAFAAPPAPQTPQRVISNSAGDLRIGGANWKLESSRIAMRAGTIRLDLRDTFIPEGETVLDIECKAGDVVIFLPDGLDVQIESRVKLGSNRLLDQRTSNGTLYYSSNGYAEAERKVRLQILVKFGDIHVTRVG
jgi:hypothetical protein